MTKTTSSIIALLLLGLLVNPQQLWAGNPDRQGEAGAYELLLNPWARSAGLNGLVTARTTGVEALYFNPAGLARMRSTELMVGHSQYLVGTGMTINSAGFAQGLGTSGTIGVSIMSLSFGAIPLTTTNQPEGIGTFKPSFFNIGLSYGHVFRDAKTQEEKITVGFTVRVVSESIANANATGISFDAGVQYVTGKHRQIKFGIALRNIGTKMRYRGEGMSYVSLAPNQSTALTVQHRTAGYDLPSLLHLGISYDFLIGPKDTLTGRTDHRVTTMVNFTANSYSRDQYGIGFEYSFKDIFMVRTGYKYEIGMYNPTSRGTLNSGLAAGATIEVPVSKSKQRRLGFDYAFEYTQVFKGTHTIGVKLSL